MKRNKDITIISSQIKQELIELSKKLNRLPIKKDNASLYYKAKKIFKTWSNALFVTFGVKNVYHVDKQKVINELLDIYIKTQKIPKSKQHPRLTSRAQRYFGSWNKALKEVFGEVSQNRYGPNVSNKVKDFIKKYQRLPLREEFNGKNWPYWESVIHSLNVQKWSDIFKYIDLTGLVYFYNTKHGYGSIHLLGENIYLSKQEYLIGKYLTSKNINFEKEVPYKNSKYIFDFYLPDYNVYIEYYGIGTKDYKKRIKQKRNFYNGRTVIEIFKHDNTIKKLDLEVQRL